MTTLARIQHPIPPLFDAQCRVLILGSFPSVKSREACFFYGHPQNRFWRVMARVFAEASADGEEGQTEILVPATVTEKKTFLLDHHVAVWDVIATCDIAGSADSSIRNVVANDLSVILSQAPIQQIFVNGKAAQKYYQRYTLPVTGRQAICLPSTSPANAAWSADRLVDAWRVVRTWVEKEIA